LIDYNYYFIIVNIKHLMIETIIVMCTITFWTGVIYYGIKDLYSDYLLLKHYRRIDCKQKYNRTSKYSNETKIFNKPKTIFATL
jgi:hypothetical protein